MRSHAYTDFIKNDMNNVNLFDFYVPYEPGMHLESMDKVLWASKLGAAEDMSVLKTAYAMVSFWYEQVSMRMDQVRHFHFIDKVFTETDQSGNYLTCVN